MTGRLELMNMLRTAFRGLFPTLLAGLTLAAPAFAKDSDLPSAFTRAEVRVNGIADEWTGLLFPLGDRPIQIGAQNDRDFLYLCLTTKDAGVRTQLLTVGADIWVNGQAKKDKTFGVRFPTGPSRDPLRLRDEGGTGNSGLGSASSEIEILLGNKVGDRIRIPRSTAAPFEAGLGEDGGMLVLELKVPLHPMGDRPNAIGAEPGKQISVGLFLGEPAPRPEYPDDTNSPGGSSSIYSTGAGSGARPRMRAPRDEVVVQKPIRVWLNVALSAVAPAK